MCLSSIVSFTLDFLFQASNAPENHGFVRWINPPPIYPHVEYIYYLQNRTFDLEMEVSNGNNNEEEDNNKGASSLEEPCTNPYCNCPCHKNKRPPASLPPPTPYAMAEYYGEGATQFAIWENYQEQPIVFVRCHCSVCCFVQLPKACQVQSRILLPLFGTGHHMPLHVL